MKRIGLFFGSFNPPHIGHALIAQRAVENGFVDEVCFVVSPHNPLKDINELDTFKHRLDYVKLLCLELGERFYAISIEENMPYPSYTSDTLRKIISESERWFGEEEKSFSVIMGTDSMASIEQWKDYKYIIENFEIILYKRFGDYKLPKLKPKSIFYINEPIFDISSTQIRERIKQKKSLQYMIPQTVLRLIKRFHSYE